MKNFTRIPNNIIRNPKITPAETKILLILLSLSPSYPSHKKLIEWSGQSKTTVKRVLRTLRDKGIINWEKGGKGVNNQYRINPSTLWKFPQKKGPNLPSGGDQIYTVTRDRNRASNNTNNNKTNIKRKTDVQVSADELPSQDEYIKESNSSLKKN